jgi:hypothetical protein
MVMGQLFCTKPGGDGKHDIGSVNIGKMKPETGNLMLLAVQMGEVETRKKSGTQP